MKEIHTNLDLFFNLNNATATSLALSSVSELCKYFVDANVRFKKKKKITCPATKLIFLCD